MVDVMAVIGAIALLIVVVGAVATVYVMIVAQQLFDDFNGEDHETPDSGGRRNDQA